MGNKILLLLVIFKWIYLSIASDFYARPHILVNVTEEILEPNDNYSVFCQGNRPLKWTIPEVKNKPGETPWTTFKTVIEEPTNTNFKYGVRLYITNMTYPYVGFYNCHFENAFDISEKNDENSRIYLFVNDKNHLAVFSDDDNTMMNVYVVQQQTALIGCRPTSPEVKVTLTPVEEGLEGPLDLDVIREKDRTLFRYDLFYGFFTNQTFEIEDILYKCKYSRDGVDQDHYVDFHVETAMSYIPSPVVTDENRGHTTAGEDLILKCNVQYVKSEVIFSWILPQGEYDSSRMSRSDIEKGSVKGSVLTVHNSTLDDSGLYICNVSDHQNHQVSRNINIKIYDKEEHNITMREVTDTYKFEAKAGEELVKWSVIVWGHPSPTKFYWINPNNDTIPEEKGQKYELTSETINNGEVKTLVIKHIDLVQDYGIYKLVGSNKYDIKYLEIFLNITNKPIIILQMDEFHLAGVTSTVKCEIAAHPTPEYQWEFKACLESDCEYTTEVPSKEYLINGITFTSEISLNKIESGRVKCSARNSVGSDFEEKDYIVTDIPDGFGITLLDKSVVFYKESNTANYAVGENINVACSASKYKYGDVQWLLNGSLIGDNDRVIVSQSETKYSNKVTLNIKDVSYSDAGLYSCVSTNSSERIFKNISIVVTEPMSVEIIDSNMENEILEDFPKSVSLRCFVKGIPKPTILWYKNNVDFNPLEARVYFDNDNQMLVFNETVPDDQGTYKCDASNKDSSLSREVKLKFKNAPVTMQSWLVYIIVFLLLALVGVMVYLFFRVRKERRMKREMKLLGLANFEKGAVENINPELGIDDQAELLPYDRKWEFPIEQLKLGKQLGSGAFGVVLKGEAKHIIEGEPVTTVAVKMVKKNADNTYIKALASELKIMVHLGKHLNVVNLLGACTKNVVKRELLVIVEYCRFGNLQNFLLRHREHFINQIDPNTGKVNYLIGQEELNDRTYSVSSNRSNTQSPMLKYAALVFSDSGNNPALLPANAMGDYRTNANSGVTEVTTVTQGEEGIITSSNSIQPEWRTNYKGDYKGNVNPISTKDLIAWSFQIARGMEYLASRKVLHGDLAARNVLLSDENIVKICDFGLAKSMYKNDNYKKRGDCPLPVKWMAIESIRDRVFSTQSDAWSFGIVLWELFSLGRTPYPGMEADERLYHKLVDGYRLESPEYAPNEIYQIMTECWSARPTSRPSFTKLTEKIGTILEDTLRKHYIDLNDPYLAMNTKMLEENSDYLAMLSPPSIEAAMSPHYVNDMVTIPPPSPEEGYMSMTSNSIFSPRATNGEVFNFATAGRKRLSSEYGQGHELLPMLHSKNESEPNTPLSNNAVSNPSYHLPPVVGPDNEENTEIVKSADNYVNMPQNKTMLKDNKKIENVNETKNEWDSIKV